MSEQLESLLGPQRRVECAKHDAELRAAEPATEPQRTDDHRAPELQVQDFRERGLM